MAKERSNGSREYDNAGTNVEVSAFKKGLLAIDLQTIRERLAGKTITRQWKRDLMEAEFARRTAGDDDEQSDNIRQAKTKQISGPLGRRVAAAIIAVCSVIVLYALYEYLMMQR